MKFKILHPSKDVFKWEDADYIVNFAQQNGIRIHGHTLLWPRVNPKWVTNFKGDSAAWENILKVHIETVVKHFKGKVELINSYLVLSGVRLQYSCHKSLWEEKS